MGLARVIRNILVSEYSLIQVECWLRSLGNRRSKARRNLVDNSSDLGRLDQLDLLLELVETSFPISIGSII